MKTKTIFLWMLLLMMVGGVNGAWAETESISGTAMQPCAVSGGKSTTVSLGIIDLIFTSTIDRAIQYNSSGHIKIQSGGTSMTVNCPSYATITSVTITTNNSNYKFNSMSASKGSFTSDNIWEGSTQSVIFTSGLANVDEVTSIEVTYTDSRASLSPTFDWSEMEIHNTAGDQHTYVCSSTFVYDSSKDRMKVRLTVTPKYDGIYGTISSSDETVLKTTGYTLTGPTATTVNGNNAWEIYIDNIQVLKTGSATLRFWFNGNASYKPTTLEIPITVIDHSITPFNNSYRFTWDFAGGNWASTIAQLGYGNGSGGYNWTKTVNTSKAEARPTYHTSFTSNDIDMIKGLAFTMNSTADLCLDWYSGRQSIWMAAQATVTIPNLIVGQTVTITADANNFAVASDKPGRAIISGNVLTVTTAGDLKIEMTANTRIYSIAVSNSQYGWSYTTTTTTLDKVRPTSGTFTFTEPGPITGGKEIDEVPGITLTVGASGDTWEVVEGNGTGNLNPDFYKDASHYWNIGYVAVCKTAPNARPGATSGCFYTFEAIVNGELTIQYYTRTGAYIYNGASLVTSNGESRIQNITLKVEAGKTYTLEANPGTVEEPKEGILWLNSFTFTPMFFHPGTTTNQRDYSPAVFAANINTDKAAFPKLINPSSTTQQDKVKFAGDKSVVFLYKNNEVDLLGYGQNVLIRGTVLDKNNEDGLVAYYYLNSNVLNVTEYELDDQAYIDINGLTDGQYYIKFSGAIESVANSGATTVTIQVKKDNESVQNVEATISGEYLYVPFNVSPFASLESGSTYRMTIPEEAIALSSDAENVRNTQIIRTFSVTNTAEPPIKMIYPVNLARVGDPIVLQTDLLSNEYEEDNVTRKQVNIDSNCPVTATLKADGESDRIINANITGNRLVFKPETPLSNNKTYTLYLPKSSYTNDGRIASGVHVANNYTGVIMAENNAEDNSRRVLKHDKTFVFKTATSSGTEPHLTESYPANMQKGGINYSGGTITMTFDQAVEIAPYTTINVIPVNGSEDTAHGATVLEGDPAKNFTLWSDNENPRTIYFNYVEDGLRYDLWMDVVIPANAIIGSGGTPNTSEIRIRFKMDKKSSSLVNSMEFDDYPYTWNFGNIASTTNSALETANTNKNYSRWYRFDNSYCNYTTNSLYFPQGEVLSYNDGSNDIEIKEVSGIRWSLVQRDRTSASNRIRLTGNDLSAIGGTHYLTIPDVPAGKLYIKARNSYKFDINTPGVTFIQGGQTDNTKGATGGSDQVFIINVPTAGDVSFCIQDVHFKIIAVATQEKAISSVGYATNARDYSVDYTLDETLLGTGVTAYKITGVSGSSVVASPVTKVPATTTTNQYNGVMLHGSEGSWPLFTLDVNSTEETLTDNKLIGVVSGEATGALDQKTGSNYNYVLSNGGYTVKYETGQTTGKVVGEASGVGFYLLLKDGTVLANNSTYTKETPNDYTAYLQLGEQYVMHTEVGVSSARQFFSIDFGDETTDIKVIGSDSSKTTSDDAFYSLQGVRLDNPGKGIYIRNGKMVVVK